MSDDEHIRGYTDLQNGLSSHYARSLARTLRLAPLELGAVMHLARGELTAGQLSHALVLGVDDVMALIDDLERAGHAEHRPHAQDPKLVAVALSESTLSQLNATTRPLADELDAIAAALKPREREVIGRFLEAVTLASERSAEIAARTAIEGDDEPERDS